ncbi:unnamed protein product [Prunus brigantina]
MTSARGAKFFTVGAFPTAKRHVSSPGRSDLLLLLQSNG